MAFDFTDFFDPVGLDRPAIQVLDSEDSFSHQIRVHTPDQPVSELDKFQVALVGVPEDRNGFIKGSNGGPDVLRRALYQLAGLPRELRIYDLGNIKAGSSVNDSYYALRDVILELQERGLIIVILGGSQDLCRGVFLALEKKEGLHHVLSIDSMLDFSGKGEKVHSRNYLDYLMKGETVKNFCYTNLGHQAHFTTTRQTDQLADSCLESIRLGVARSDLKLTEPLIRDSEFISIDMGAVRHSDAPGASLPSPNGFFGDELCQLSRYAGMSKEANILGIFELCPEKDINGQTAHLGAQAVWYFLEGITQRISEDPLSTPQHMKQFIVNLDAAGHDLVFHKSSLSDRWWMEIPVKNRATGQNFFISCSYEEYQQACRQEIPDRWWRYLHKLGTETG